MKGERVMTFDEWWKECSGWYTEDYDASGLSEWCLAKDAWYYQQERIAKLEAENKSLRHLVQLAYERAPQYLGTDWHIYYERLLEVNG